MTFFADLWADIQIFISNYTYYFGTATNIALVLLCIGFFIIGVVRTARLPQKPKKRGEIKYLAPESDTVEKAAKSLSQAVKCATVTGDREELEKLLVFLRNRYKNVFAKAKVSVVPSGALLLQLKAAQQSERKPVMLCGHMDVVPAEGVWKVDPFSGFDDGNAIWGRGTLDCKGGMIAIFEAVESLLASGYVPKRDLYFAFGADEETGGAQGAGKIAEYFEKRNIQFDFILNEGGSLTSSHMGNKQFPAAIVAVAEKAGVNIRLTAKAEGGHAAVPGKMTSVGILSEAICRIENAPMHRHFIPVVERYLRLSSPALTYFQRFCLANDHIMRPFLYGTFRHDKYIAHLFRTTFVPTQIKGSEAANVIGDTANAIINVRILQGDTVEKAVEHIKAVLADLPVEVEALDNIVPSKVSDTNTESYELVRKTIEKHFGAITIIPSLITRGSDMVHYEKYADNIYRFSPIMMSQKQVDSIHGTNEYIRKEALGVAVEFYKTLLSTM